MTTDTAVIAAESGGGQGILGTISAWAISVMESLGSPGAGLAVALENVFPPIPSEIILPLAGFTASRGDMNLVAAIIWTTVGSTVGAFCWYFAGILLGPERTRRLITKLPLVKESDVIRTEEWFSRHGNAAVFFGRMVPIIRSFISIPAGVERMPAARFALFTALGSLVWNTLFIMAGFLLGENWSAVEQYVGTYQQLVVGIAILAVIIFVTFRVRRHIREKRERESIQTTESTEFAESDQVSR